MKNRRPVKSRPVKSFAGVPLLFSDEGQEVLVEGDVIWISPPRGKRSTLTARVRTETSTLEVKFFRSTALHRRFLVPGAWIRLKGKLTRWHGRPCLVHPRLIIR
jgi:RecG-like helicase